MSRFSLSLSFSFAKLLCAAIISIILQDARTEFARSVICARTNRFSRDHQCNLVFMQSGPGFIPDVDSPAVDIKTATTIKYKNNDCFIILKYIID